MRVRCYLAVYKIGIKCLGHRDELCDETEYVRIALFIEKCDTFERDRYTSLVSPIQIDLEENLE